MSQCLTINTKPADIINKPMLGIQELMLKTERDAKVKKRQLCEGNYLILISIQSI